MLSPRPNPDNLDLNKLELPLMQETPDLITRAKMSGANRSGPRQEEEYFVDALVAHGSTINDAWNLLRLADRWSSEVRLARYVALKGLFDYAEARHHGSKFFLPGGGFGGGVKSEKKLSEKQRQEELSSQLYGHCQSIIESAPAEEAMTVECSMLSSLEAVKAFFSLSEAERYQALEQAGASFVTEGKGDLALTYLQGEYLACFGSPIYTFLSIVDSCQNGSDSNGPGVVKLAEDALAVLRNSGTAAATFYINAYLDCLKDPPQFVLDLEAYQDSALSVARNNALPLFGSSSFARTYLRDIRGQDYFADVLEPLSSLLQETNKSLLPVLQGLPLDFDHLEQTFRTRVDHVERLWNSTAAPAQEAKRIELLLRLFNGVAPDLQETLLEKMAENPAGTWSVLGLPLADKEDYSVLSQVFLEFQHLQVGVPSAQSHLGELIMSLSSEKKSRASCLYLLKEGVQHLREIQSVQGTIPEDVKSVLNSLFDGTPDRDRMLRIYFITESDASRELIVNLLKAKTPSNEILRQLSKKHSARGTQPEEKRTNREKRELLYSRPYAIALQLVPEEERSLVQRLALAEPHAGPVVLEDIIACSTSADGGKERENSLGPYFLMLKDSSLFRVYRGTLRRDMQPQDHARIRETLARLCAEQPRNPYKELYAALMQERGSQELPIRFFPDYVSDSSVDRSALVIDPTKEVIIWHGAPLSSVSQSTVRSAAEGKGLKLRFRLAKESLSDIQLQCGTTIIAVVGSMSHSDYYAGMNVAKNRSCRLHQLPPTAGVSSVVSLLERAQLSPAA